MDTPEVPERWQNIAINTATTDGLSPVFLSRRENDLVIAGVQAVLADLRRQVEALPSTFLVAGQAVFVDDVLGLIDTGGSDG